MKHFNQVIKFYYSYKTKGIFIQINILIFSKKNHTVANMTTYWLAFHDLGLNISFIRICVNSHEFQIC